MKALHFTTGAMIASGLLTASAADPKPPEIKNTAYQGSVSEEQLRADTKRVMGEISALKDEFGRYPSVQAELARLERAAGDLGRLEESDMREAARILRDASRLENPENTKSKVLEAATAQKKIQTQLREIADRLAVQRDLAEMQQRFEALALRQAANLRETREAQDPKHPDNSAAQAMAQAEQAALAKEIATASESLKEVANTEVAKKTEAFTEALQKATEVQLPDKAQEAARKVADKDHQAADSQQAVLEGLKNVVAALDAGKPEADRAREMAAKLAELAEKQDQLTTATTQAGKPEQDAVRQQQEKISDQTDLAKSLLDQLSPQAAEHAANARDKAEEVVKKLDPSGSLDDANQVAKATDQQKEVAKDLDAASDLLKKKAEELEKKQAGSSQGNPSGSQPESGVQSSPQDQQAQEQIEKMDGIAQSLKDAKLQMRVADRQMLQQSDLSDAEKRLSEAGKNLEEAAKKAAEMQELLPAPIGEHIAKASELNGQAKGEMKNSGSDKDATGRKLSEAEGEIDRALAGLKEAAEKMAEQGQKPGDQQANQKGQQPGGKQPGQGQAPGELAKSNSTDANMIQAGKAEVGQREALSLLQQEKAPAEYEEMVRQYIRNLANGELPAR
ncbi:MAG: hypothetical protein JWO82_316 [Akkermansiaceae bacterium]|nr:hypothetical protein [Akkermansiaceae bacterium]